MRAPTKFTFSSANPVTSRNRKTGAIRAGFFVQQTAASQYGGWSMMFAELIETPPETA